MSHGRTVEEFVRAVDRILGREIQISWRWFYGLSLKDETTGEEYCLGMGRANTILTHWEQESICRQFGIDPTLLGLDPGEESD